MARPTILSDEKILDAARRVFLERGIRATTAEVAREAGVAEGSLFKRWKTKYELFFAALNPDGDEPECLQKMAARVGRGDLRLNVLEMGIEFVEFFRRVTPLVMMSWSNPPPNGVPAALEKNHGHRTRFFREVAGYFEAEMRSGRIAQCDTEVLARAFVGSLWHFCAFEVMSPTGEDALPMPASMYVRSLVDVLWNGIRPKRASSIKERKR